MRVKRLDIFGFKSFATKQSIHFGKGVTAVVGPNGCGKSNVVDALRWVMGEQNARHLRGGQMQDIIFCGSERKAALGFAEVTLTIENDSQDAPLEYNHFNEIQITRRLYKTGESEYQINKQKSRLKDISEFFLGTGVGTKAYSIIEQGRINDLISSKPIDRRIIIEEAAGITKYKAKKTIAEKRIQATKINLDRIIDIKNEVEKRVATLTKEKEKLLKAQSIIDEIKRIDLHLASYRYLENNACLNYVISNKSILEKKILSNKREVLLIETKFDKALKIFSSKNEQKRLLEELINQHKNSLELFKKDLEYNEKTLTSDEVQSTKLLSQMEDIEGKRQELDREIKQFNKQYEEAKEQLDIITRKLDNKKNDGMGVIKSRQDNLASERDLQTRLTNKASEAAQMQAQITGLLSVEEQRKSDLIQTKVEQDKKNEDLSLMNSRILTLEEEFIKNKNHKSNLAVKKSQLLSQITAFKEAKKKILDDIDKLHKNKTSYFLRLQSLEEISSKCEWSDSGVSKLIKKDSKNLIKEIVANVIKASKGYERLVEICLSHILDSAILSETKDLAALSKSIKENNLSQTSFFVLGASNLFESINKPIGLKPLSEVANVTKKEFLVLSSLLKQFFVASDISCAIQHWPAARLANVTLVTNDGELLFPDGRAVIWGAKKNHGVLDRKTEIDSLREKVEDLEKSLLSKKVKLKEVQAKLSYTAEQNSVIEQELDPVNISIVRLEETIKQRKLEVKRLEEEVSKLSDRYQQLSDTQNNDIGKINNLKESWAKALDEHKNFDEQLKIIVSARDGVEAAYERFQQQIKEIEILKIELTEKTRSLLGSLEQSRKMQAHFSKQKEDIEEQIAQKNDDSVKLKESIRQIKNKLIHLKKDLEESSSMFEKITDECSTLFKNKSALEQELSRAQKVDSELLKKVHQTELQINNITNDMSNICERIKDKYKLNLLEQLTDFHHMPIYDKEQRKVLQSLERQRANMGAVNENASNEFDEFNKRNEFLKAQITDLSEALEQLQSAIRKINQATKIRFIEAFNNINKKFSEVFPRLFNGGRAELVLTDKEDLLNSGVEIIAKPPGKNIGSIELMSGGEKALTAISLVMAIFLIKPSPFCLLDEVDAPLDETNVSRFSSLIKEMSELSQFIVITHNRKTMEVADQLYGVTMEDAGMSKVVSVQVNKAYDALVKTVKQDALSKPTQLFLDEIISS